MRLENIRRIAIVVGALTIWILWGADENKVETLQPGETVRIETGRVVVTRKHPTPRSGVKPDTRPEPLRPMPVESKSDYVPPEGRVEVSEGPSGIEYRVVRSGFTFRPGLYWVPTQRGGLDAKLIFKGRYGFNLGGDWDFSNRRFDFGPSLSAHPNLRFVSNLEVALGYSLIQRKPWVGLRTNF